MSRSACVTAFAACICLGTTGWMNPVITAVSAAPNPRNGEFNPHHAGIHGGNRFTAGASGSNSKVVIALNHCMSEKQQALMDVESAQNTLRFCEREAANLRDEEERCRMNLHSLTSEVELLKQENTMLKLRVHHAEDRDTRCGEVLQGQIQSADKRVREVVDAIQSAEAAADAQQAAGDRGGPENGGSDVAFSFSSRHRARWESKVHQLELKLLASQRDVSTLEAQKRSLEGTIADLSHSLEKERITSRRLSASLSPNGDDAKEDEESVKHRLRAASASLQVDGVDSADSALASPPHYSESLSDEDHTRFKRKENDLLWQVRQQAAAQNRQQQEAAEHLERLRRTVETHEDDKNEDGSAL